MTDVLLCVGNSMMGDDGAGPLLAEMCAANPAGQWVVIDGGSAPENDIVAIRELRPERLLIVDATDMGLNPGDIRIIDPDDIAEMFMMTTHNMPLNYLVDQLKEDVGEVIFLGRRTTGRKGAPFPALPAQDSLSLIYRATPRL